MWKNFDFNSWIYLELSLSSKERRDFLCFRGKNLFKIGKKEENYEFKRYSKSTSWTET